MIAKGKCLACGDITVHPAPDAHTQIYAVATGCTHGITEWSRVSDIDPESGPMVSLSLMVATYTRAFRETVYETEGLPHNNWVFFAMDGMGEDNKICAVDFTMVGGFTIRWDACPLTPLGFHSQTNLSDWALAEFVKPRETDQGIVQGIVIPLN